MGYDIIYGTPFFTYHYTSIFLLVVLKMQCTRACERYDRTD